MNKKKIAFLCLVVLCFTIGVITITKPLTEDPPSVNRINNIIPVNC